MYVLMKSYICGKPTVYILMDDESTTTDIGLFKLNGVAWPSGAITVRLCTWKVACDPCVDCCESCARIMSEFTEGLRMLYRSFMLACVVDCMDD